MVIEYGQQPERNYGGLLKHLMHNLMKLNRALLHSLWIKWPLHFRPKQAKVVCRRHLYRRGIDALRG